MKKAFDANVPKLRPRLKSAVAEIAAAAPLTPALSRGEREEAPAVLFSPPSPTETATAARVAPPHPSPLPEGEGEVAGASVAQAALFDVASRRERLEQVKRRVADAARPSRVEPAPAEPGRAAESALTLVKDLEAELVRARELEGALRVDLDAARKDLARTAAEARLAAEKRAVAEKEAEEKRGVLAELLAEMQALEGERDEAIRRAQALAALDEERQKVLDELSRRGEELEAAHAEARAEADRVTEELQERSVEGARLRAALSEVTRERDHLAREADAAKRERDALAEAKRALEQVHQALSQARARLA